MNLQERFIPPIITSLHTSHNEVWSRPHLSRQHLSIQNYMKRLTTTTVSSRINPVRYRSFMVPWSIFGLSGDLPNKFCRSSIRFYDGLSMIWLWLMVSGGWYVILVQNGEFVTERSEDVILGSPNGSSIALLYQKLVSWVSCVDPKVHAPLASKADQRSIGKKWASTVWWLGPRLLS